MEVSVKRGCIEMTLAPKTAVPVSSAVDDMLGLSTDSSYISHLLAAYPDLWGSEGARARTQAVRRDVAAWLEADLPAVFESAARAAGEGHLSSQLASHVEGIRRRPGRTPDEVDDLPTLAAWALDAVELTP